MWPGSICFLLKAPEIWTNPVFESMIKWLPFTSWLGFFPMGHQPTQTKFPIRCLCATVAHRTYSATLLLNPSLTSSLTQNLEEPLADVEWKRLSGFGLPSLSHLHVSESEKP